MERQARSLIISLSIVLLIAYSVIMTAIGIHSFIKAQNLKQQIFSLNLARQELDRKTEIISSQLQDYEKVKAILEQSLERLNKESKEKLEGISSEIESYKNQVKELKQTLKKAQEELLSLRKENKLLKEAPVEHKERQKELQEALVEKEGVIAKLEGKVNNLEQELRDKKATLHYNLAVNFSQRQDFENAIIEYEKALNIDPDHFSSHYNLGILYEEYKKDYSQAISHYSRYLQLRPDDEDAPQIKQWILDLEAKQVGIRGQ